MELVKCGRCGVSLTLGIMFPIVRNATALETSFLLFHDLNIHFRGANVRPLNFRYWQKLSSNAFAIFSFFFFGHSSPHRAGDEERAQLVSRRVCDPSPYDTPRVWGWWNPMDPIVPFGFIYARTCHIRQRRTLCQSYSLSCFEKNSSKYTPVPFVTNGG